MENRILNAVREFAIANGKHPTWIILSYSNKVKLFRELGDSIRFKIQDIEYSEVSRYMGIRISIADGSSDKDILEVC
jgi:acyl-ACP thioesterase